MFYNGFGLLLSHNQLLTGFSELVVLFSIGIIIMNNLRFRCVADKNVIICHMPLKMRKIFYILSATDRKNREKG